MTTRLRITWASLLCLLCTAPAWAAAPIQFDTWPALAHLSQPERPETRAAHRFVRSYSGTELNGVRYMSYKPGSSKKVLGFQLTDTGSRRINPAGLRKPGPTREYLFSFPDRARQEIHLLITDNVAISGRYSHDNMFREMEFFPRIYLPTFQRSADGKQITVLLPTGEEVHFSASERVITGGVLSDQPIDMNRSRHQRHHPRVQYRGDFLAITSAQRGDSPRNARVWGQQRYAEIVYPKKYRKPCRVPRGRIWDQRPLPGDRDPRLDMLFKTDKQLFDFVEQACGWDLSELRKPPSMLRLVQQQREQAAKQAAANPTKPAEGGGLMGWLSKTFGSNP